MVRVKASLEDHRRRKVLTEKLGRKVSSSEFSPFRHIKLSKAFPGSGMNIILLSYIILITIKRYIYIYIYIYIGLYRHWTRVNKVLEQETITEEDLKSCQLTKPPTPTSAALQQLKSHPQVEPISSVEPGF